MRKDTSVHYATAVTQYARHPNGQAWANPEYALAAYGNTGCSISNIYPSLNFHYPFGNAGTHPQTDYLWKPDPISGLPQTIVDPNEHLAIPYILRFSGFTFDDVGITSNCIVTNLYIHLEYTDDTIQKDQTILQHLKINGANWLISVHKANGERMMRKRFEGLSTLSNHVLVERIPCMKDQSWSTNTFGWDLNPNVYFESQRSKVAEKEWYEDENEDTITNYRQEYYEKTESIRKLTIGDINDPGFYIDVQFGRFHKIGGVVKIKSFGISAEYIQPYNSTTTLYPLQSGASKPKTIQFTDRTTLGWINPDYGMSLDTTDQNPDTYCSVNLYSKYVGTIDKPYGDFDSDVLLGRLPAISNIDDTQESISDMILSFRIWDYHLPLTIFNLSWYFYNRIFMRHAGIKWSYVIYDGFPLDKEGQPTHGTPVWKNSLKLYEPGVKRDYNLSGQDWINCAGGWNEYHRDFYGREFNYWNEPRYYGQYVKEYLNWYNRHYPIRRYDSEFTTEIMNSSYYPGMTYDPLWIEKALKNGNLFIGLSISTRFRPTIYYKYVKWWWNDLRWHVRVKGFGLRLKYNRVLPPPVTGPSGPIPAPPDPGLLVRFP